MPKSRAYGSQFCSKCGTKLQGASAPSAPQDTNKVLKEDQFRRIEKTTDAFSKKNDGTLTLFNDRLEWKGKNKKNDLKIPVTSITSVSVVLLGGDQCLEMQADIVYKFMLMRKHKFWEMLLNSKLAISSQMANVQSQLDSWRGAIDKVCGRL